MTDALAPLAAQFFGCAATDEIVAEFLEHIGFEMALYAPIEALTHRDAEEVVGLAIVLQKMGFTQAQSFRVALVAVDGRSEENDMPEYVHYEMLGLSLTWQ